MQKVVFFLRSLCGNKRFFLLTYISLLNFIALRCTSAIILKQFYFPFVLFTVCRIDRFQSQAHTENVRSLGTWSQWHFITCSMHFQLSEGDFFSFINRMSTSEQENLNNIETIAIINVQMLFLFERRTTNLKIVNKMGMAKTHRMWNVITWDDTINTHRNVYVILNWKCRARNVKKIVKMNGNY